MIQDTVALAPGNPRNLTVYADGIWGNIDREVDEWTSINQLYVMNDDLPFETA
ncbi:hypothetical protein NC652_016878 [Populus alba x Populus x berolinensis]|nr:hypothetical protein NC652_016878 [Populus alba x Populus x berolinensis]